jgi:UDP-N-acetylglucosamine acyltransferase
VSIHPTAIIDPKAELDGSVIVGPFCVIDADVKVGAGCRLYQGVYLTGWTEIGPGCELHPGVIVGHAPQDTKYAGERTYCRIGRGSILREHVTVHRGTTPESETLVGEDCFLLAGTHVAHNCVIGNRVTLINNVLMGGHVHIADGVTVGGAGGIHQFVRIGELAMLAATGRFVMDVVPYALTDTRGKIAGLNRVGLRRAEMPREEIAELRNAYRILFGQRRPFRQAVEHLAGNVGTPAGRTLLDFLQADSKRGIAGSSRTSLVSP